MFMLNESVLWTVKKELTLKLNAKLSLEEHVKL